MHIKYFPRVTKKDNNKHKKQLNKIDGRNRDGSTKKYSDKGSRLGIIRYILHPYCFSLKYIPLLEKQ